MRTSFATAALLIAMTASSAAQQDLWTPCKFGQAAMVQHLNGVSMRRLSFVESEGGVGATIFIPDSAVPVPGIVFSHSAINGVSSRADLLRFAHGLAYAGAASIVLDGVMDWQTSGGDGNPSPHLMACAGQWLLLNAVLDRTRLAVAGSQSSWGGEKTPWCRRGEQPCWHPILHLNFGKEGPVDAGNLDRMLTSAGQLEMAKFVQRQLQLAELSPGFFTAADNSVPGTCPVTKPSDKPFVPPYPYPPRPNSGGSWYGTDRLWTRAPVAWRGLGHYKPDDPTFRQKMQWWRQGYDYRTERIPKLKVTGRRLDAPAAPLMAEASNVAGALPSMMVGINLPTLGCWEITGHYENDELTLVVWVAK